MKKLAFFFAIPICFASLLSLAPLSKAQGTFTAASCNYSDVNAVVNGPTHVAVAGDTIKVPAGTCTWTSGQQLAITVGITLIGNGTPNNSPNTFGAGTLNTTIIDNNTSGTLISANRIPQGQFLRISSLIIQPLSSSTSLSSPLQLVGACNGSGCPNLRVDNLNFTGWSSSNGNAAGWMVRLDGFYGVADHNSSPFTGASAAPLFANVHYSSWLGVGNFGDNSRASPDSYGTASQFYFENNSLGSGMEDCDITPLGVSGGGCRITVRFNHQTFKEESVAYFHGTDTTQRQRGGRQLEEYGNSAQCSGPTTMGCDAVAMDFRSGTGLIFGNNYNAINGAWNNSLVKMDTQRIWRGSIPPFGPCDGTSPWDVNASTITTATVCLDQPTRSGGILVQNNSSGTPVLSTTGQLGSPNEALDPIYEFMDSGSILHGNMTSSTGQLIGCRDWYTDNSGGQQTSPTSPFNGTCNTTGNQIGWGTLANRPTTCTTGVSYWATDQGNWNSSGQNFPNGTSQGQLYKCSATNTWALSYAPYAYPHPLVSGSGSANSSGTSPAPPNNLTATVQ
jgi:hypothetical protein